MSITIQRSTPVNRSRTHKAYWVEILRDSGVWFQLCRCRTIKQARTIRKIRVKVHPQWPVRIMRIVTTEVV